MQHAPNGYDDQYESMSPRAPWTAQHPQEHWQGVYDPHGHSTSHPRNAASQPGQLGSRHEEGPQGGEHDFEGQGAMGDGQRRRHRRGGHRHRRPMLAPYPGWVLPQHLLPQTLTLFPPPPPLPPQTLFSLLPPLGHSLSPPTCTVLEEVCPP